MRREPGSEVRSIEAQPMRRFWLGIAATLLMGIAGNAAAAFDVPEGASGDAAGDGREQLNPKVRARLLVDAATAAPGAPVSVGVLFDLLPGWHIYWRASGQAGLPTELAWEIDGAQVGPIHWPAPSVFRESDGFITTYGYGDQVLLWNDARFRAGVSGEIVAHVKADFLVCKVQCIPGNVSLHRTVNVGGRPEPALQPELEIFERYAALEPVPSSTVDIVLDAFYSQSAVRPGDEFKAAVAVTGPFTLGRDALESFIPDALADVDLEVTGSRPHPYADEGVLVNLSGRASPDAGATDDRLRGVLALRDIARRPLYVEVDLPFPRAPAGAEVAELDNPWLEPVDEGTAFSGFFEAVLLALLGGLILNLMPCVLPVLAIKVFSITELAHQSRSAVLANGGAYAAGILVSMAALAAVVIALRSGGLAVGWGFQFQEPLFVAAIATVLVLFALNLFGVFEILIDATRLSQVGAQSTGLRRSFFEGLLAVVLATPCSAPFLGTAVGFAFASPAPVILAIFLAVGVGLAAPFVLITWVPGWARLIPRSGPWMVQLRRVLGFALLATVVWLLWITGRSVGSDGLVALLAFLVAVAFGAWIYGAVQVGQRRGATLGVALALGVLVVVGLARLPLEAAPGDGREERVSDARAFDPVEIRSELAGGRAVFVYFTADWCLTCKVNERVVLRSDSVREELALRDVAVFVADWTRRDEQIRAELASFGRAGVPMYLVYNPKTPEKPELLPELLTTETLIGALRRASPAAEANRGGAQKERKDT